MDSREAEVACENYWVAQGAVRTRRPVRTKWQKQDYLGADVLAVMPDGGKTWSQVTTSQNRGHIRERRRKLEEVPWAATDRVFVFELEERPNIVNRRTTDRFFRVHEYRQSLVQMNLGTWEIWPEPVPITPGMLRVRASGRAPATAQSPSGTRGGPGAST